jgi:hypothetical protein
LLAFRNRTFLWADVRAVHVEKVTQNLFGAAYAPVLVRQNGQR